MNKLHLQYLQKTQEQHLTKAINFDEHIGTISKSCHFHLQNVWKRRKYLTQETTEITVHGLLSQNLILAAHFYMYMVFSVTKSYCIHNSAAHLHVVSFTEKLDHLTPAVNELRKLPVKFSVIFKLLLF